MENAHLVGLAQSHAQQFINDPMEGGNVAHLQIALHIARGYYVDYHHYSSACISCRINYVSRDTWDYHARNEKHATT